MDKFAAENTVTIKDIIRLYIPLKRPRSEQTPPRCVNRSSEVKASMAEHIKKHH